MPIFFKVVKTSFLIHRIINFCIHPKAQFSYLFSCPWLEKICESEGASFWKLIPVLIPQDRYLFIYSFNVDKDTYFEMAQFWCALGIQLLREPCPMITLMSTALHYCVKNTFCDLQNIPSNDLWWTIFDLATRNQILYDLSFQQITAVILAIKIFAVRQFLL